MGIYSLVRAIRRGSDGCGRVWRSGKRSRPRVRSWALRCGSWGGAAEADSLLRLSLAYLTALLGAGHEETQATRHLLGASAP